MRKHNPTLFIECLTIEIVGTYLAGISEEQEKQCLQKWRQNSDFSRFLRINISKLSHRILIIFFSAVASNSAAFDWALYLCYLHFFTLVIIHSLNPSFAQKFCSSAHFGGHFE